ncbi:cobalamin B12-binding domain-containing protein [Streptomyces olivaceoviridis]|uniref:cobalamin B12-binding domain-containing protein n=1 Tax=Streptomyces olivaceoviridis TaxID=1921 RepID=UPI0036FCAB59
MITDNSYPRRNPTALLSSVSSDSHTWNLVYLELVLAEAGYDVHNLGPCVPDELLIENGRRYRPDLIVISSVNGHGASDGTRLIQRIRADAALAGTPVVIGGKLGTDGTAGAVERERLLLSAGFAAVFEDATDLSPFLAFAAGVHRAVSTATGRIPDEHTERYVAVRM